jgi:hypothetical protein
MKKRKVLIEHDSGDGEKSIYEARVIKHQMNDSRVELRYYRKDSSWTPDYRGAVAVSLHDHGNGVKIKIPRSSKKIKLGYDEVVDILVMLSYYMEDSGVMICPSSFKKFKEKKRSNPC